jgi:hypothetical protein
MMRVFICAGPQRSGSTWLFNAVRMIASPCYSCAFEKYIGLDSRHRHVVKVHRYASHLHGMVFITERPEQDRVASMRRFSQVNGDVITDYDRWMEEARGWEVAWRARAKLIVRYDDILERPDWQVERIANTMGFITDPLGISERLARLPDEVQGDGWDETTLLRKGHRTLI